MTLGRLVGRFSGDTRGGEIQLMSELVQAVIRL